MGTTIIKNRQLRPELLQSWLTPKGETPLESPQNGQYLSAVLNFVNV